MAEHQRPWGRSWEQTNYLPKKESGLLQTFERLYAATSPVPKEQRRLRFAAFHVYTACIRAGLGQEVNEVTTAYQTPFAPVSPTEIKYLDWQIGNRVESQLARFAQQMSSAFITHDLENYKLANYLLAHSVNALRRSGKSAEEIALIFKENNAPFNPDQPLWDYNARSRALMIIPKTTLTPGEPTEVTQDDAKMAIHAAGSLTLYAEKMIGANDAQQELLDNLVMNAVKTLKRCGKTSEEITGFLRQAGLPPKDIPNDHSSPQPLHSDWRTPPPGSSLDQPKPGKEREKLEEFLMKRLKQFTRLAQQGDEEAQQGTVPEWRRLARHAVLSTYRDLTNLGVRSERKARRLLGSTTHPQLNSQPSD